MTPILGDSLRNLRFGLQTTKDIAPGTWYQVPLDQAADHTLDRTREVVEELRGTLTRASTVLQGPEHDGLKLESNLFYDWHTYLWATILGMPTTTSHPIAGSTVKVHKEIENVAPPLIAFQFDDGVSWWQELNCIGNMAKVTQGNGVRPKCEFDFLGDPAQPIATPGDLAEAIAAYAHPIPWPAFLARVGTGSVADAWVTVPGTGYVADFAVTATGGGGSGFAGTAHVNGSGGIATIEITNEGQNYTSVPTLVLTAGAGTGGAATAVLGGATAEIITGTISVARNRVARNTGKRTVKPSRFTVGDVKITYDITPDYKADTASLFKGFRDNVEVGAIEFEWQAIGNNIGSPAVHPKYSIMIPRGHSDKGQHQLKGVPVETPLSGIGKYSSVWGGGIVAQFTNEVVSILTS